MPKPRRKASEENRQTVFFTIISQNYTPQARCLFESLRIHYPDARHVLCLIDETADPQVFSNDEFEVVLAKDVVGAGFYDMAYKYSLIELNSAIKPFAMRWLFENGAKFVTYIDPDCYLYSPLDEVFEQLSAGANIVLTPHATQPIDDGKTPGEVDFLRVGTFNLGFIAVQDSLETRRFLQWWSDRLSDLCVLDPVSGLFVDQKWMDLAPSFFEGVSVLRHPGYNVAYWNVFQRNIERLPGGWHVDGEPLRFFHFSAVPTDDVSSIADHQDRLDAQNIGPFITEFHSYLARMASNALKPTQEKPYTYAVTWQGKPIESHALRAALRRSGQFTARGLEDFRDEQPIAALLEPHPDLPVDEMFPVSRLLYDAWLHAPRVSREYPLFTAEGRAKFFYWVLTEGFEQLEVDPRLLPWGALLAPVAGAIGGRFAVPPIVWLIWLSDKKLRRTAAFDSDRSYGNLLIELQRQIDKGKRPASLLPRDYWNTTIVGEGDDAVNVAQYAIWCSRPDLQSAFDIDTSDGRRGFITWCAGPSPAQECPWMARLIIPDSKQREFA
jgi:hypothetical protein